MHQSCPRKRPPPHDRMHSEPEEFIPYHMNHNESEGVCMTYSIRDQSSTLDTSRLGSLEEVHDTLCLQSLQLRVEADECPTATNSITVSHTYAERECVCMKERERESVCVCVYVRKRERYHMLTSRR